jgi:hypothetical protein
MKKYSTTFALIITAFNTFAQNIGSNVMLVRHDTSTLKGSECVWIMKSLTKNDPALKTEIGKPVTLIILEAIEKGKLRAIDPGTNNPIPGKEIFTWHMPVDTAAVFDNAGNSKIEIVQHQRSSDNLNQIRIYQDWYFDVSTGKFHSIIKWLELLEEIHTSSGIFIGIKPFCRILY